jgi:exonuclease III
MKIISWNIRGLNGRSKQRLLRDMLIAEKPDIMLLQETKCAIEEMDKILPSCWKQGQGIYIVAMGAAGGLALLWNPNSVTMDNFFTTKWSISTAYRLIGSNKPGYLTNVYGPTNSRDKHAFLRSLEHQATLTEGNRWILGGDFNMICNLMKKEEERDRLEADSGDFQRLIDNLGLVDPDTSNGTFTWTNRRTGSHQIACRLDRFLLSDSLMLEGTTLEASILDFHGSDHWPIQLWLDIPTTPGRKPFRLEQFWLNHPDFQQNAHAGGRRLLCPMAPRCTGFSRNSRTSNKNSKLGTNKLLATSLRPKDN